jgi:glycerate 2-kinase
VIVSGGGSSLLCDPHDMTCSTLADITDALFRAGATIDELNTVRKHTSRVQGGQLAALAHPATVVSCVFSDVPGNDFSVIASGPTMLDQTTREDAVDVLTKYDVLNTCALPHCELLETPKNPTLFKNVYHTLIVTNDTMLAAMASEAQRRGYDAHIVRRNVHGEAKEMGVYIAREATKKKTCFLYGGETTVSVGNAKGKGGRNQEVALGALWNMMHTLDASGKLVLAAASDGWDNGPVAGAIADGSVAEDALLSGLDPEVYLENHDAYPFFEEIKAHIITGRTGANVADVYMSLTE